LDELHSSSRVVPLPLETLGEQADSTPAVEETVSRRDDLALALAALSPEDRAAVLMVDAQGFAYRDAAEAIGVPEGTIGSRLNRARAVLRAALEGRVEGVSKQ
jgi:RNA polymerase sigma-70 factor, ECF subfamily